MEKYINYVVKTFIFILQLDHPNIVKFMDSFLERESFCIVTEFCEVYTILMENSVDYCNVTAIVVYNLVKMLSSTSNQ